MKNTKIIKRNNEFKYVFNNGQRFGLHTISLYICKNNKQYNKFGISISKKYGKAVKRNYIKRLIRESYKVLEPKLNDYYCIVVLINKNVETSSVCYSLIYNEFEKILKKAGCLDEKILD